MLVTITCWPPSGVGEQEQVAPWKATRFRRTPRGYNVSLLRLVCIWNGRRSSLLPDFFQAASSNAMTPLRKILLP